MEVTRASLPFNPAPNTPISGGCTCLGGSFYTNNSEIKPTETQVRWPEKPKDLHPLLGQQWAIWPSLCASVNGWPHRRAPEGEGKRQSQGYRWRHKRIFQAPILKRVFQTLPAPGCVLRL